jgi:outer membrane lipoprotein-sorting protein
MKTGDFVRSHKTAAVALMIVMVIIGSAAAQDKSDPYEILGRYFDAAGGLDNLRAERTQYFEGTISMGGMQGSIRAWTEKPDRNRMELELGPLNIVQGENGEVKWTVDTNGKLQVTTKLDEAALKRDEVERRMAEYEYADPGSDAFSVVLEGRSTVEDTDCYEVRIDNSINADHHTYYISTDEYRLLKSIDIQGEESADRYYGDYREVDGLTVAFYTRQVSHLTGQTHEIQIADYESNPVIDAALFDPPEPGGRDYEFTAGNAAEDIPFRFIENHLFIPVSIAGVERLWVLDTGASMSVIDQSFADEMGLKTEGNLKGSGAGGTVDIGITTLPPFEVEGIRFGEQKVAVIDMAELIRRIGVETPGILGFDFLSRFVTRIDFANELISFYDPESFTYMGQGTELDAHIDESVFKTHATLDGSLSGTWLFDIGASGTHLDPYYVQKGGYADRKGVLRMAHGAANEYQLKGVRADRIEFGGFALDRLLIGFAPGAGNVDAPGDRLGILGNNVFRNFVVYVDYVNEKVILEKGDRFNQPWPEDRSGLNVEWTADHQGIEVLYVSPGTPAEEAGFQKGDVLKSINGKTIEPAGGVLAVRELLREEPGVTHKIVVDREGREKKMKITLADLY